MIVFSGTSVGNAVSERRVLDLCALGLRVAGALSFVGGLFVLGGVGWARWSAAYGASFDDIYNVIVMSPASLAVGMAAVILGYIAMWTANRTSRHRDQRCANGRHPQAPVRLMS